MQACAQQAAALSFDLVHGTMENKQQKGLITIHHLYVVPLQTTLTYIVIFTYTF